MARTSITPVDRAADHRLSELFFSTTDSKGVITSCNEVFLRVAGYQSDELLGAPHSIIRHPDMPRCVFKLLWDYLLAGRPIGAYVKNMTSRGEYYWVFALAFPIEEVAGGRLLSIRLKPSAGIQERVEELYGQLLKTEASDGESRKGGMLRAGEQMLEALGGLGYSSYDQFMVRCLQSEIASRSASVGAERDPSWDDLVGVFDELGCLDQLQREAAALADYLELISLAVRRMALNANIFAAHMGKDGRALGVISEQASGIASDIAREASNIAVEEVALSAALEGTSLHVSTAILLAEMTGFFRRESETCQLTPEQQRLTHGDTCEGLSSMLARLSAQAQVAAGQGVKQLRESLQSFRFIVERFARILLTTRISHVTGRSISESVNGGKPYSALLDELAETSGKTKAEIDALQKTLRQVERRVRGWKLAA